MMKNSKAFVLSISVFMIVMFALLYSQQFLHKSQGLESSFSKSFALQKAAFVSDNVSSQAAALFGERTGFENSADSSIIILSSSLPCGATPAELSHFKNFAEGEFSSLNNASLSIDFSEASAGVLETDFSNGLKAVCSNSESNSFEVFSTNDSSMPLVFDLNIESSGSLDDVNAWQWQPSGDLEVRIHYKDSAITVIGSGRIDSSIANSYSFNYAGGSLTITAGKVNGNSKALLLSIDNGVQSSASITSRTYLPLQEKPSVFYNAGFSFRQAGVEKTARIGRTVLLMLKPKVPCKTKVLFEKVR